MAAPFIFIGTHRIKEGKLRDAQRPGPRDDATARRLGGPMTVEATHLGGFTRAKAG
jgi:hypothetical protein